jgi:hypothetical protein
VLSAGIEMVRPDGTKSVVPGVRFFAMLTTPPLLSEYHEVEQANVAPPTSVGLEVTEPIFAVTSLTY